MVLGDENTTLDEPKSNVKASEDTNTPAAGETSHEKEMAPKKSRPVVQTMAGTGTGILLGSAGAIVATAFTSPEDEKEEVVDGNGGNHEVTPDWSDGGVEVPSAVNDEMSFSEAFAAARAEVGPGGAFEWRGNVYSTYTAEEWENMSEEEKDDYFEHFSWGASSSSENDSASVSESQTMNEQVDVSETETIDSDTVEVDVIDSTPEVEILGVAEDQETGFVYGGMIVGDQEVVLVDLDPGSGESDEFDVILVDINNDGEITEDEILDVSDEHFDVDAFEASSVGDSSLYAMEDGSVDYASEYEA